MADPRVTVKHQARGFTIPTMRGSWWPLPVRVTSVRSRGDKQLRKKGGVR